MESIREVIKKALPALFREDPELRAFILELTRSEYAGRAETQDRFWEVLGEIRREREERTRQWEQQARRWEENDAKWKEWGRRWDDQQAALKQQWAEQARKWDENDAKWKEWGRRWDEQQAALKQQWAEQARKWEENDAKWKEWGRRWDEERAVQQERWKEAGEHFDRVHDEIMAMAKRHDRSVGALGARWGLKSESTFRNALAGILEESFGVKVMHVDEYDDEGTVFGRPEQVELDVIIVNGQLIVCELKSSIDKAGMYIFERKVRFYEKRHDRSARRMLVISPMIDPRAQKVAAELGIETFSDSMDVEEL